MNDAKKILGLMLVKNDDLFVGQALSNILAFCDRVIVLDNCSNDRTPEILKNISASSTGKVEVHRLENVTESQSFVLPFLGHPVWMFAVDGDEVYDPSGLARLRSQLLAGDFDQYWRLYGHVLNVTKIYPALGRAKGYTSPPGHPMTKLYNLEAIQSWEDAPQRLHGGKMVLRPNWQHDAGIYAFFHHMDWEESPFRCLHMVFVQRSSKDRWGLRLSPADNIHREVLGVNRWEEAKVWLYHMWTAILRKSGKDVAYRKGPQVERDAAFILDERGSCNQDVQR